MKKVERESTAQHGSRSWKIITLSFFAVLAIGQLQRVDYVGLPAFYLHDVLLGLFLLWGVTQESIRARLYNAVRRLSLPLIFSVVWIGIGLVFAAVQGQSIQYPLLLLCRLGLFTGSAIVLYELVKRHQITPFWLSFCLFLFFSFLLYFGLLQYFFLPDTRFLFFVGWDDHMYRLISTLFDPGFTGLLLVLGFVFLQQSSVIRRAVFFLGQPALQLVLSGLFVVGVLLTYSRASYLAFVAAVLALSLFAFQRKEKSGVFRALLFLVVFAAGVFVLPRPGGEGVRLERTSTVTARAESAQTAFAALNSPVKMIVGQGLFLPTVNHQPSVYSGDLSHAQLADNWLVMVFVGTGVVGVVLSLFWLTKVLWWAYQNNSYFFAALCAVLVNGVFNASVVYPFVWISVLTWAVIILGKKR